MKKEDIETMAKVCDLQLARDKYNGESATFHVYGNEGKYYVINDNIGIPVFEADNIAACKDWYLDMKMGQVPTVGIF